MKRLLRAIALSTFCFAAASACGSTRVMVPVKPEPARMDCRVLEGGRPPMPAEYVIDWSRVQTVAQARSEHDAFVRTVRTREGVAAGYIIAVEERLFLCANDALWLNDFFARLPDG